MIKCKISLKKSCFSIFRMRRKWGVLVKYLLKHPIRNFCEVASFAHYVHLNTDFYVYFQNRLKMNVIFRFFMYRGYETKNTCFVLLVWYHEWHPIRVLCGFVACAQRMFKHQYLFLFVAMF